MPWTSAQNADFTADDVKPWLPIPVEHRRVSVQTQQDDPSSVLEKTKALIALRHRLPGFVSEIATLLESPKDMLVFERGAGSDALLFVFNLSPGEISYEIPVAWRSGGLLLSSVAEQDTVRLQMFLHRGRSKFGSVSVCAGLVFCSRVNPHGRKEPFG